MSIDAAIAMNRFGLGAKPRRVDVQDVASDPRGWLIDQLREFRRVPSALADQPNRRRIAEEFQSYQDMARDRRMTRKAQSRDTDTKPAGKNEVPKRERNIRSGLRDVYGEAVNARLDAALASQNDFPERLVHFWSNHFAVSVDKAPVIPFAGNYEFTAIRPHIMGNFADLLIAAVSHPAMLFYLDQAQSVGPNSILAQRFGERRNRELGLNENLAREILELHTLGVRTGYDQSDVTELARSLTGTTVTGLGSARFIERALGSSLEPGKTVFVDQIHEPGMRQIMGRKFAEAGEDQARAILRMLAVHPATAHHISVKLAAHFIGGTPPPSLVERLERDFLQTGGDLRSLYTVLVLSDEVWPAQWDLAQARFKSPWEWLVSSLRMVGLNTMPRGGKTAGILAQMGQPVWRPGSPAGYADEANTWAGSATLMRRVELAAQMADRSANRLDARALGPAALPGTLGELTAEGVARAESPAQGLALLLVSPEFLRR